MITGKDGSLKSVLSFQTLTAATLGKWATTHEGFFLRQELLLDFAAWMDLTSNTDNLIVSTLENQNTLCFFKTC